MKQHYDEDQNSKRSLREKIIGLGEDSIHKNYYPQLQKRLIDIENAYDATLEGWALALELREHETEKHTQRVKVVTTILAKALDFGSQEIVHIQRGALLHDIGKMGIPDSILLKPGPLNDEEWIVMRQHPEFALKMLSKIEFLRPALVIPYCHHERWDGSGYPKKAKGTDIPLEARLFAIVDVWDALSSDRVYRKAWEPEKIRTYFEEKKGVQFDPEIVDVFLKKLDNRDFSNDK